MTFSVVMDLVLHLDRHLQAVIAEHGMFVYPILFAIIFAECGILFFPFLPGDSLLFAAGTFAGMGSLPIAVVLPLFLGAAIAGNIVNYQVGLWLGPRVARADYRFLNRRHLLRTQEFFEQHGGKAIIFARFLPVIRTFAPFVAGVAGMRYRHFMLCNVVGAAVWVNLFTLGGYFFGNTPFVRTHFATVLAVIIAATIVPPAFEFFRRRMRARKA